MIRTRTRLASAAASVAIAAGLVLVGGTAANAVSVTHASFKTQAECVKFRSHVTGLGYTSDPCILDFTKKWSFYYWKY